MWEHANAVIDFRYVFYGGRRYTIIRYFGRRFTTVTPSGYGIAVRIILR